MPNRDTIPMKLEDIRREYLAQGLDRDGLQDDPILQLQTWLEQAISLELKDATAMTIASVSEQGIPNQRIVLLKHLDNKGLVFYTNYKSSKARELEANPNVCAHFPWHPLERQVKVQGVVNKVSEAESLAYFRSRPRDSQLAAWASEQSARISSREVLLSQFESLKLKFQSGDIPLPDFWGGYRIQPSVFEFWQGRENRLHDRFEYRLSEGAWQLDRLAP